MRPSGSSVPPKSPEGAAVIKSPWNARWRVVLIKVLFFGGLLIIWEVLYRLKLIPDYVFPGPSAVAKSVKEMASDGTLAASVAQSMKRMAIGYSLSLVGGLTIGILCARLEIVKLTLGSLVLALQSLPSICWLPLSLLWFGLSETAILVVVVLGALFSIAVSTEGAIRNIPPIYKKVGLVLGARGFSFSKDILFFAALPEILSGLKVGWTFAWRSLMAAELIQQGTMGVGRLLETGRQFNDIPYMLASIGVILTIGLVVDQAFSAIERTVRRRYGLEGRH